MSDDPASIPVADPAAPRRSTWLVGVIPLVVILIVVVLVMLEYGRHGPDITVTFNHAYGLKIGDGLQYRGMEVGEVREVALADDAVKVQVRLREDAAWIASAGSRFWIVRPQIKVSGVTGLETVVGARYLAVEPGGGNARSSFVGINEPPVRTPELENALEIVLQAPQRGGIMPGAPVHYRQVEVGRVLDVGFAIDASSVEITCAIAPQYADLIHTDTRFWRMGGVRVEAGILSGVEVRVQSLSALIRGGVAFATPSSNGKQVYTGHRFHLAEKPEEEWVNWQPSLDVGSTVLPAGSSLPHPLRATLVWDHGRLWVSSERRAGWVVPVAGRLYGLEELLTYPEDANEGTVRLEVDGKEVTVAELKLTAAAGIVYTGIEGITGPKHKLRAPDGPEDVVVVTAPNTPRVLAATRITASGDRWPIDGGLAFAKEEHGAAVCALADGAIIGFLAVTDGRGAIVPVQPTLVP